MKKRDLKCILKKDTLKYLGENEIIGEVKFNGDQ